MDRKKEKLVQPLKETKLILKPTPESVDHINILTRSPNDDDTSNDSSDALESWTLVSGKKSKFQDSLMSDSENSTDILKSDDNAEEDHKEETETKMESQLNSTDFTNDDFSDGISIISETESIDRLSPHPFVADHLPDLNLKFSLNDQTDNTILSNMRAEIENDELPLSLQQGADPRTDQQLRQRRKTSTAFATPHNNNLLTMAPTSGLAPLLKRGLKGIFYVGVCLAVLGLIGKILYPSWQPLQRSANYHYPNGLEQKLNDIELQNNLMRVEIDLLDKQVKYLSSLNNPKQQKSAKHKDYKGSETFTAWSGNGDTIKPILITKKDLKSPYKCPDDFVEIVNMCVQKGLVNEPSLIDQFGEVLKDLKQQSEAFKTFEEAAKKLQDMKESPIEQSQEAFSGKVNAERPEKQFAKNKPIYDTKKYRPKPDLLNMSASLKEHNIYDYSEGKIGDRHKPVKEYRKSFDSDNRQSREYEKYSKHDNSVGNSKEKKNRKDNSKERYTKHFNDSEEISKERYRTQKHQYDPKKSDDDDSRAWQDKYMRNREQQRIQNEQKIHNSKNWFIKRGNSREIKRSSEIY